MIKRITAVLLLLSSLVLLVPFNVSSVSYYTKDITDYNGVRYENYLVIYNTGSSTGTNPYGYEVTVTNGIVTRIGGNDSDIPSGSNSFVVSGHGTMSDWLSYNIIVGMKCSYSTTTNQVTFVHDDETLINYIKLTRDDALAAKNSAIEACIVYDASADTQLASAETVYEQILADYAENIVPTRYQADELVEQYNLISSLYTETAVSEYRGAWVRPTQTNYDAVDTWVKKAHDNGLNMISVETLYNATMIFPTPSGSLFEHNPAFYGFDVLDAYVTACHKYGMELHVWMPVFYSGSKDASNWRRSVAYKKPDWCMYSNHNSTTDQGEYYGMVFLNPALDEVQECLIETYEYILTNYDIDGFQLDYIRYSDRGTNDDYGYDKYTIAEFKQEYPQYASRTITYNPDAVYWNDWVKFRALQVTEMVHRVRRLIDRVAPDVMLTADVGPSYSDAYNYLYQDYRPWLRDGLLDMIHPMAYGTDYSPIMKDFINWAGETCLVVPGLGTYMSEFNASDMVKQTRDMLAVGCDGVVYFEITAFFNKDCGSELLASLFTQPALPPNLDVSETFKANLLRMKERLEKAEAAGTVDSDLKTRISNLIDEALVFERPIDALETLAEAGALLDEIESEVLIARLSEDLIRAAQTSILELRDSSALLEEFGNNLFVTDTGSYIVLGVGEEIPNADALTTLLPYGRIERNGSAIDDGDILSTNQVLTNGLVNYEIIVKGDLNGDGLVKAIDYILLKRQVLNAVNLSDAQKVAANVHKPEVDTLNKFDYMYIKRHVLKTLDIYNQ